MDPSVAARLAASPSATSSRSHSSSSPSTSRLAHSSSVTGLNGEDSIMSSAMTIEQVLAAHASAPDPLRAALESVLHERNSLSAQNSQLWNHLKKQRSNYQMAASDVKRIRAERDNLRSRLARYEHLGSSEHFEDKRTRPLAHGTATEMTTDYNEKSSSEQAHQLHFTSRPKPSRHQSEDRTGKQTFPGLCSNSVGVINFFFNLNRPKSKSGAFYISRSTFSGAVSTYSISGPCEGTTEREKQYPSRIYDSYFDDWQRWPGIPIFIIRGFIGNTRTRCK